MTKPATPTPGNLWETLRAEAKSAAKNEPALARFFQSHILKHRNFGQALAYVLATRLVPNDSDTAFTRDELFERFENCAAKNPELIASAKKDLIAICTRDPAAANLRMPFLYFKGYHALQLYRMAHVLWQGKRRDLAFYLQSRSSGAFDVDIHPAARIGHGVMMDHATGIVVGETAVIENDVSLLHGVTLGGTGKEGQDRHPKIRKGALIGAGSIILGNIEVGEGSLIAAGSVVLKPVPPHATVAGVPARIVGKTGNAKPGTIMDQIPEFAKKPGGKLEEKCDFPY